MKFSIGSYDLVVLGGPHLTLVFRIVVQGGVRYPKVVNAMATVSDHSVSRKALNYRGETWWKKYELE